MSVITRFAPSPTGYMHLGNCRTALFSYLWMLNSRLNGNKASKFILRIEDTDRERSKDEYTVALCEDLAALGIKWDVGPDPDPQKEAKRSTKEKAEYTQSLRGDIYRKYYDKLIEKELAYPCFCSEAALKITRKKQLATGQPPRYSGVCRSLSPEEVQKRLDAGEKPVLRFKVPDSKKIKFSDRIKGDQEFLGTNIGDFVIKKSTGEASFMFANAIDDALMGVNLVVRGEDHLSNTPNQLLLLEALELPAPDYAHISLVVGHDGKPLSKRTGNYNIRELLVDYSYPRSSKATQRWECLPIGIINYLARLGNSYESEKIERIEILGKNFKPQMLSSSATLWDPINLDHWEAKALYDALQEIVEQKSDDGELSDGAQGVSEHFKKLLADKYVTGGKMYNFNHLIYTILENAPRLSRVSEWVEHMCSYGLSSGMRPKLMFMMNQRADGDPSAGNIENKKFYSTAIEVIKEMPDGDIEALMKSWNGIVTGISKTTGLTGKPLFSRLRMALTGSNFGPPLDRIYALVGKEEALHRLQLEARSDHNQVRGSNKL